MADHRIVIQTADFVAGEEDANLRSRCPGAGAVVSFIGLVRDQCALGLVDALWLEHYPGMSERSIRAFVDEATYRWRVSGITVIHRVGHLLPTEQIVLVLVASLHRSDAFSACEFVMDALKTQALFWKKEWSAGEARWLEFGDKDRQAFDRWG